MKKLLIKIMIIISIILVLIGGKEIYERRAREHHYIGLIGLSIPEGSETIEFSDSHGGFHGDGEYYEVISLEDSDINSFVEDALNTGYWSRLPMSRDLRKFIHGEHTSNYSYGGYGEMMPDNITNGLYYFKDRYRTGEYIFDRFSQNFNFALFDINNGRLYILKYDS